LGGNILLASKVDDGAIELMRPIETLEKLCRKEGSYSAMDWNLQENR
jgi:hypothetical protein